MDQNTISMLKIEDPWSPFMLNLGPRPPSLLHLTRADLIQPYAGDTLPRSVRRPIAASKPEEFPTGSRSFYCLSSECSFPGSPESAQTLPAVLDCICSCPVQGPRPSRPRWRWASWGSSPARRSPWSPEKRSTIVHSASISGAQHRCILQAPPPPWSQSWSDPQPCIYLHFTYS